MAQVSDGQNNFSGGVNNRLPPESLRATEYADGLNLEIRDGSAATRRGSTNLWQWVSTDDMNGAGLYQSPLSGDWPDVVLVARGGSVWQYRIPSPPTVMTLPGSTTIGSNETVRFMQGYQQIYLLRGAGKDVLRWSGRSIDDWETLADPATGDKFPSVAYAVYAYNRIWAVDASTLKASDLLSEAFDFTTQDFIIDSVSANSHAPESTTLGSAQTPQR